MRIFFLIAFLIFSVYSFSQINIQATVRDSKTKEVLQYCNIAVKNSWKGTITNAEGVFSISVDTAKDTVLFYYMGYLEKAIPAVNLIQEYEVFLQKRDFLIPEITVHTDNDYLYEILKKCRQNLKNNKTERVSKVYYGLETQSKEFPIELVECYYNGYLTGAHIDELRFKNGRTGHSIIDDGLFFSLNSSKANCFIDLTHKNNYFPTIPFQLNKRRLKKTFNLELENIDEKMYIINFSPHENKKDCFSGKVWIEKGTFALLKIDFAIENTTKHPFLPWNRFNSILGVSLNISNTYKPNGSTSLLDHINFNYKVSYKSCWNKITQDTTYHKTFIKNIVSNGIMYFYDYDKPFILPYFEYDNDFDDYFKMSFIVFNKFFWNNNNTLLLTDKQKENLGFFSHEGQLINFREKNYNDNYLYLPNYLDDKACGNFRQYYFWFANKRIRLISQLPQNKTFSQEQINKKSFKRELYNLKVQILLDVCRLNDSLHCSSYSVFDQSKSYYHLPEQSYTNAFINIYFDICEIERRKMEKKLNENHHTIEQIDSIYNKTLENIDRITTVYLKEVQLGKKKILFRKWNKYVYENLNINNIELFEDNY